MAARAKRSASWARTENRDLIDACRSGDNVAWSEVVSRYERLVYAIPLKEGLSHDEAADVAQDTFAALMTGMHNIADPERLGAWLMTVARRFSWRHRNRRLDLAGEDVIVSLIDEDIAGDAIQALWVYEAVNDLGEPCRSVILGLFFDPKEPSYEEIALRIGRPLGSIGPLRTRGLERLRRRLEETAP